MVLTFVLLYSFVFSLYQYKTGGSRIKAILGVLLGLATLAKGPLGILLPSFTFLTFLCWKRNLTFLKQLRPITVISTCVAIAGSWYLLALWQGGREFLFMVIKENFALSSARTPAIRIRFGGTCPISFSGRRPGACSFHPWRFFFIESERNWQNKNPLFCRLASDSFFLFAFPSIDSLWRVHPTRWLSRSQLPQILRFSLQSMGRSPRQTGLFCCFEIDYNSKLVGCSSSCGLIELICLSLFFRRYLLS